MLNGIPKVLSPELLKVLMEMGHGDEIVIADGNFPSVTYARNLIRCDGHGVPAILAAILQLMPLDTYVQAPVVLMAVADGDATPTPAIWKVYNKVLMRHGGARMEQIERFAFYERARAAHAVIATSESAVYANVILKKGVIKE